MEQVFLWWVSWSNRVGREGERQVERGEGGGDISDGHSITARMWNRSFSGGCPGLIGEGGRETGIERERERGEGGRDISDGHSITARMWNRSFSGGCPGLIG